MFDRKAVLEFVKRHQMPLEGIGRYRYSQVCTQPTLYSSCYAVMTLSLLGDLDSMPAGERAQWAEYLQSFQQDDGLLGDPVIYNQGWYAGDPFDCGRPHLTCHVLTALACLGAKAAKQFALAREFSDLDTLKSWLEARDWGERVGWTGNEIMNLGTILQYSRDFHGNHKAGRAIEFVLDWLESHHLNPATGVWGDVDTADPDLPLTPSETEGGGVGIHLWRSHAVQAAYHWWPLFAYDNREFPYAQRAIDTLLSTQNPRGGFGWGVHNPSDPWTSSACEDIDSIDPLARLSVQVDYRRDDIRTALARARTWVLGNQVSDGGFVFIRDVPFEYGHPELMGPANTGAMFPTWFRTLSLAIIDQVIQDGSIGKDAMTCHFDQREKSLDPELDSGPPAGRNDNIGQDDTAPVWAFVDCPGFQFWRPATRDRVFE